MSNEMKILHIHTKMVSGGIEAIVCNLVNEMSKTHDVTLCTIFQPTEDDVFYRKLDEKVKKITIGKKHFGFSIKEIWKIYRVISQGHYDVVHIHGCFQYYFLAIALLHSKVKFVYTIHSDARRENQVWDWRLFKLKKYMFAHRWMWPVTISEASQQSFEELYHCNSHLIFNGIAKNKTEVSNNNVIDRLRTSKDTKVFIHAGRISKPKNQLVLCRVFKQLVANGKDVVLVIAGSPEEKAIYESIKPYFSDRIIYLGERNDIAELMSHADAFCLPSLWEGLPVTLLEALSVGCIPICSPVGGIVNVIESGKNGLLSKDSSESEYLKTVNAFLNMTDDEQALMKESALKSFEKYDIKNCAYQYLKVYSE